MTEFATFYTEKIGYFITAVTAVSSAQKFAVKWSTDFAAPRPAYFLII